MSTELVARRTQYSSCDDCRKSRVACDGVRDGPSCTRCVNRQRPCTFLWVKNAKPKSRRKTQSRKIDCTKATSTQSDDDVASSADTSFTDATARNGLLSPPNAGPLSIHDLSASDATGPTDAQWLPIIYRESWEAIFGTWMGRYSCPFTFV